MWLGMVPAGIKDCAKFIAREITFAREMRGCWEGHMPGACWPGGIPTGGDRALPSA